jgi:4-hydroxybenzoate polyprenyltransferase
MAAPSTLSDRLQVFGRMIKFSHTVFALPFALAAVVLAQPSHGIPLRLLFWILVAMVGARSAAMGFNRIADLRFDRRNPRTAGRALPAGVLSLRSAAALVAVFSLLFILAAAMLNRLCFLLSFPVLLILFSYSYTKRFTVLSHVYLGFSISLAPIGAWIAVTGSFSPQVLVLSLALLTYIAGFDILYACQDTEFDRQMGLFSLPACQGPGVALHISALLHGLSFICFFLILLVFDLGVVYLTAVILIGLLFILEHKLVKPDDLSRIEAAFFQANCAISLILFLGVLGDKLLRTMGT